LRWGMLESTALHRLRPAKTCRSAVETAFHKAADRISTLVDDN
jgi:hypothetical protein